MMKDDTTKINYFKCKNLKYFYGVEKGIYHIIPVFAAL